MPSGVPQKYQNKKFHRGDKHGRGLSCNPDGKKPPATSGSSRNVKHNHEEAEPFIPASFPEDHDRSYRAFPTTEKGQHIVF